MAKWQVIVGNIGAVEDTDNGFMAQRVYSEYLKASKSNHGRAGRESVVLMRDGEIYWEHCGEQDD